MASGDNKIESPSLANWVHYSLMPRHYLLSPFNLERPMAATRSYLSLLMKCSPIFIDPNWSSHAGPVTENVPLCIIFNYPTKELHDRKIYRDTEIDDAAGRKLPAMTLFAEMIQYLKNLALPFLISRVKDLLEKDAIFVHPVPAIRTDSAKRFMRAAAKEAGIDGGQLTVVSEPEAAIYCQLKSNEMARPDRSSFAEDGPGTKYMVIHLGSAYIIVCINETFSNSGNIYRKGTPSRLGK